MHCRKTNLISTKRKLRTSASGLIVDFVLPLKTYIKGREQVWASMFALIHLCQWWGQGNVLHSEWREGGWNATAEYQFLFPDEIIRDSSEAVCRRSASPENMTKLTNETEK